MEQLPENFIAPAQPRPVAGAAELTALELQPPAAPPDEAIHQAVVDALGRDLLVWPFDFNVNVRHGRVYIYGRVNTCAERARVQEMVEQTEGVMEVDNQVDGSGEGELARVAPTFDSVLPLHSILPNSPDEILAARIRQRHFWSAALHHQLVEVRVHRGQVTLTGTVSNWLDREEAGLDAYEAGARDVRNCLAVRVDLDARPASVPPARNYLLRRAS